MKTDSINYFLGSVKLTGDFNTYSVLNSKTKVVFCETRLSPDQQKSLESNKQQLESKKRQPLTRIILHLAGNLGVEAQAYFQKGDYVTVEGELEMIQNMNSEPTIKIQKNQSDPFNNFSITETKNKEYEYHLNVSKISLLYRTPV